MASITNLEELPQLVMEKITSFLNHKQLLAFEQVSRRLKCAVDDHFSVTDHLIIGPLPEVKYYGKASAKDKKCFDGLLNIIKRCGIRLRTIQITNAYQYPSGTTSINNYSRYCKHFLASDEVSNNCPNIEYMFASPNMDIIPMLGDDIFHLENVLLDKDDAEIYANNIKLSTGDTCKLRSIRQQRDATEHSYKRIVNLFSNLEQISVSSPNESFYNILPQLMENGLKDLSITSLIDFRIAKKLSNICKDLRTFRICLCVENVDDIAALNKLQLPKNVELAITVNFVIDGLFSRLNENVCNYIINCYILGPNDYRLMSKLKNVQEFNITCSEALQEIAEGSFPKLRRILNLNSVCLNENCALANTCHFQKFLPQLLINKGNQLTHIEIIYVCKKSMPLVWKALKYCRAAKSIKLHVVRVDSPSAITYENLTTICDLPNLQHFSFSIIQRDDNGQLHAQLPSLLERAVKEHWGFQFQFEDKCSRASLYKVNF